MPYLARLRRLDRRRLLDAFFHKCAALGGALLILTLVSVVAVMLWFITPLFNQPAIGPDEPIAATLAFLIFGSLKGAVYALLFAIPMAVFSALYTSQFMSRNFQETIKPLVEILSALPSVVLGFIAAAWVAPFLAAHLFGLFLTPIFVVLATVSVFLLYRHFFIRYSSMFEGDREIWLILFSVLVGGWLAFYCGGLLEDRFLAEGYERWTWNTFGLPFQQRNAIVVGMVLGLAVFPIVFSISEEAFNGVPSALTAGSLSLGATRWQTTVKVILPTAASGVLSSVMLGFCKAIGETMIVVFVSGNLFTMDWSMFSGFRSAAASIVLELPVASEGSWLFSLLFLTAFLLFITTFVINTLAEIIRGRARSR